jgi:hypothetical protein
LAAASHRCLDDPDAGRGEHCVEGGGELGVAVADEEPEEPTGILEIHGQVAGLMGQPGSGRMGGAAQDAHPAGGVLDDEERGEPVRSDRLEVEQVASEDAVPGRDVSSSGSL